MLAAVNKRAWVAGTHSRVYAVGERMRGGRSSLVMCSFVTNIECDLNEKGR